MYSYVCVCIFNRAYLLHLREVTAFYTKILPFYIRRTLAVLLVVVIMLNFVVVFAAIAFSPAAPTDRLLHTRETRSHSIQTLNVIKCRKISCSSGRTFMNSGGCVHYNKMILTKWALKKYWGTARHNSAVASGTRSEDPEILRLRRMCNQSRQRDNHHKTPIKQKHL